MTQQIESRSTALNRFMMVPIVVGFGLVLATGILIFKMTEDRVADGERITLSLQGDCLSSSKSVVLERAKAVGVGNPIFSEDLRTLTLTLPAIENAREHIPHLLLRRGIWEMRDDQNLVLSNQDISSAQLSLDESGMPYSKLFSQLQILYLCSAARFLATHLLSINVGVGGMRRNPKNLL